MTHTIEHYTSDSDKNIYLDWLASLRDSTAKIAIIRRVTRLSIGGFGDCKFCREGVWELKIDVGPGYRIYYSIVDNKIVLLLCGGTKKTQDSDINTAIKHFKNWQERQ